MSRKHSNPTARTALRGAWQALVMAAVVLLAVAGCASIPMHGPVGKSDPLTQRESQPDIDFQPRKPVTGASPASIIAGFIAAGTGVRDDFQVARQYLAPALAGKWKADRRTLVYKKTYAVASGEAKNSFDVTFDVLSTVDDTGVLTPAPDNDTEVVPFTLVQVDGEWRISSVPDGIVLQESTFASLFSAYSLYFYDPTFTYAVPDVRWLPTRTPVTPTLMVRDILAGPAPYLKGAVATAFPEGISLVRDSVAVSSGVATVDLTAQPLLDASVKARQQMHEQLLATLQALSSVTKVTLRADKSDVSLGDSSTLQPPIIDKTVPSTQVAVSKNELVTFDGTHTQPISGLPPVASLAPSEPAMSYDGKDFAFLAGPGDELYTVSAGQQPVKAATGPGLTGPSFAPNGWVWTALGDGSGTVKAFNPQSATPHDPAVELDVPWLEGQTVTAFRVSRDGARVLVISSSGGVSTVHLAGILKIGDVPKELTAPITLPASTNPTLGVWVGETTVAVMRASTTDPVTIEVLDLKRDPVTLNPVPGAQWLSAGNDVRDIYVQTGKDVSVRVGSGWDVQAKDLRDSSFAG
jgi:hypothetical protein